jgi:hypothetical protein
MIGNKARGSIINDEYLLPQIRFDLQGIVDSVDQIG